MSSEARGVRRKAEGERPNQRAAGFTLIEVMLAMVILLAVVGIVYASFSTTGQSVEQAEAVRDGTDLARTLMARLSDDIANAYVNISTYGIFFGKKEEADVNGEPHRFDSLSLTTLTNFPRPKTKEMELWEVGYFFREKADGTGRVLMRREKRELSKDPPPLEGGVEYELTDRVTDLRLRYCGAICTSSSWKDDWPSKQSLPKRVEITLKLDNGKLYVTEVLVENAG